MGRVRCQRELEPGPACVRLCGAKWRAAQIDVRATRSSFRRRPEPRFVCRSRRLSRPAPSVRRSRAGGNPIRRLVRSRVRGAQGKLDPGLRWESLPPVAGRTTHQVTGIEVLVVCYSPSSHRRPHPNISPQTCAIICGSCFLKAGCSRQGSGVGCKTSESRHPRAALPPPAILSYRGCL